MHKKEIDVEKYRIFIEQLRDVNNHPMNAVVRFNLTTHELNVESDLYSLDEDQITLGRACDLSEGLGVIEDETLEDNIKAFNQVNMYYITRMILNCVRD